MTIVGNEQRVRATVSVEQAASVYRPRVWVVARSLGAPSEVWISRQLLGFRRLGPEVVCWDVRDPLVAGAAPIHVIPFQAGREHGPWRWIERIRNAPSGNFLGTTGAERQHIRTLAGRYRPEAMLCHFGDVALRLLPVAARAKIPVVAHFHGRDLSSSLRNAWYRQSLMRSLSSFAALVVVGKHQRLWLLEQGVPDEKVHVIPCGVPVEAFTADNAKPSEPIRYVCVSQLVAHKGVDYTLRAFASVLRELPACRLTVIGDGREAAKLRNLADELRLGGAVTFAGALSPVRVVEELRASHVFVQHSVEVNGCCEGFGVSAAEAAACELPVVVTRCGGFLDQVVDGETGLLIPQHDVEQMTAAMLRLAHDGALRMRLGKAGRARVVERFDTTEQVRRLEDVLLSVTRQREAR